MASPEYDTEATASDGEADTGKKPADGLFRKLQDWYKRDIGTTEKWRKEAREDFRFYAGDQWSDDDLKGLKSKKRPQLTFNRVGPLVNAIVGSEINNRREVRYVPREAGDAKANEILTAAGEWFRDQCGAEDEESDAFKHAVIAGMGWCDTRLDFEDEPDGAPKVECINPFEMVWDCNAVKPNLADASRLWRVREMPLADAIALTGVKDPQKLHAGWVKTLSGTSGEPHDQDKADEYEGGQEEFVGGGYQQKLCTIVEARWFEKETFVRSVDLNGQEKEYTEDEFKKLQERFGDAFRMVTGRDIPFVKQRRKVLRRCFIGSEVLGEPDKPMVPTGMFGWECITGYFDIISEQFYGIVRGTKDPVRWANKFFSQVMFLLNSQSKGGIMAEKSAFDNVRDAESSWAQSDAITWMKDGSLSGQAVKVQPKPTARFPAGFFALFQEAKEALPDVTGISREFIGTREVDQAGVLEHQRRQSSLNLLAELFNALRRYRKRQGRVLLHLIQKHLADGRLIRIVGDGREQYVPLSRENVADVTYDIIVDDSPTSPNEKERTWSIIMQFLPLLKDLVANEPEVMMEVLEASPLPASMVDKFKKKAEQKAAEAAQKPKPPSPEEIKVKTMMESHQLKMADRQADMQAKQASSQLDQQSKAIELMMKQQEAELDARVAEQKAQFELLRLAAKERANQIAQQNAATRRIGAAG